MKRPESWESQFENFANRYYNLVDDVVDWYSSGPFELTLIFKDGKRMCYNMLGDKLTTVRDKNDEHFGEVDDVVWRSEFANRLKTKMSSECMTQDKLAGLTGISRVTINKYMNGSSSPSGPNIERIARALGCSVSELM